jgi:hypothetical protein
VPESETAGPSTALRSGRDDKGEGGVPHQQPLRRMDKSALATNPISLARVFFNAFSRLRPLGGRFSANLDSSDFETYPHYNRRPAPLQIYCVSASPNSSEWLLCSGNARVDAIARGMFPRFRHFFRR